MSKLLVFENDADNEYRTQMPSANNESSEVCGHIKPGQRVKLNRSQAVNVHKLLTIRYLHTAPINIILPLLLNFSVQYIQRTR